MGGDLSDVHDERVLRIMRAQDAAMPALMRLPNVVGTATGFRERGGDQTDEICVLVYVSEKVERGQLADSDLVPRTVPAAEGAPVPTDVVHVGEIKPLVDAKRYRPIYAGSSISDATKRGAGTLGGWVFDADGEIVLLTCNHVLTPPSDMTAPPAEAKKRQIFQPALVETGSKPDDVIGETKRVFPIYTSATFDTAPPNLVDAAIGSVHPTKEFLLLVAEINKPAVLEWTTPTVPAGSDAPKLTVMKRGRSTEKTTNGWINAVNTQFVLPYGGKDAAYPAWAQIGIAGTPSVFMIKHAWGDPPFAEPGDSGSIVMLGEREQQGRLGPLAVGMIFATSEPESATWACTIESIAVTLGVSPICSYVEAEVAESADRGRKPDREDGSLEDTKRRLRRLWDEVLPASPVGREVMTLVRRHASELMLAVAADRDLVDRAGDLLRAWLAEEPDADPLDALVDDEKVEALARLVPRLAPAISSEAGDELRQVARLLDGVRGMPLRRLLAPE